MLTRMMGTDREMQMMTTLLYANDDNTFAVRVKNDK